MKTEANRSLKVSASTNTMGSRNVGAPPGLGFELARYQNELKVKQQHIDAATREITTLKSSAAAKDRQLQQLMDQNSRLQERATAVDGSLSSKAKELDMLRTLKKKSDSQAGDLQRTNDKLREKVAALQARPSGNSEQVAALQAEVKTLKASEAKLGDEVKAVRNLLRAKDKELDVAAAKVARAEAAEERAWQLENSSADLARKLEEAGAKERSMQQAARSQDSDMARMQKEIERLNEALLGMRLAQQAAADAAKVADTRAAELTAELQVVRDELVRTSAVASRVAASEAGRSGLVDQGMVPLSQHLDEVRYSQGEAARLKERVAQLERELQAADQVKDKLRSQLDAALSGDAMMASGLRRLSLAASTPGSGSKSMRKCQSARGPGPSLPWRSAQKEAQVTDSPKQVPASQQAAAKDQHMSSPQLAPVLTRAPKEVTSAVDAPPLAPSSPFAGSPSPGHCAQAKPVGPTSSKMAWSSPKGSPMAESGGPGADTEEMSDVEVEAPLAQGETRPAGRGRRGRGKQAKGRAAEVAAAVAAESQAVPSPPRRQTRSRAKQAV